MLKWLTPNNSGNSFLFISFIFFPIQLLGIISQLYVHEICEVKFLDRGCANA